MPFWQASSLPTSGSISLNQIHVESGGTSGTTINFNNQRIRNLTGFKKSSAGAKSFSQCRGAYADGFPANTTGCQVGDDGVTGGYGANSYRAYYQGVPYQDSGPVSIGANTSSVIRYYAVGDWEDEGEGDYDWMAAVVAVAPGYGGGISYGVTWDSNPSVGNISGTNGLCRVIWAGGGSEGAGGSIENEGVSLTVESSSLYPWGITVD
jgi:hypothetical protein